ncbi:MAG: nucleotide exchange factor GrpE [Deltaproteobacteria bacterium]|nr:nucleotide exchange factor GrpE [Deltaproteobacteria bacterium]MBN2672415.1 nucleotide exchange factor GrpE [Deltaproteobacteria bacterium]
MSDQDRNKPNEPTPDAPNTSEQNNNEEVIEVVSDKTGDDAEQEILDPEQQIDKLTQDLATEREKYLRALADMDNLRKRCRRDIEEARINGRANVLEELLPALDSIDMALKSIEPTEANQAVFDGMVMVRKQFMASMDRFELKAVQSKGQKFDPAVHEAVSYIPSPDHEAGEIIDEMRAGYMLGTRLLRAAMVVVSSGQPADTAATEMNASSDDASSTDDASTDAGTQDDETGNKEDAATSEDS